MTVRIAIAAGLGAAAGELAVAPLAAGLVDVVGEPVTAAAAAVFGLPVAVGLACLAAGWLFRRPAKTQVFTINVDAPRRG